MTSTTTTRANRFGAKCADCSGWIAAEAGSLTKSDAGRWETRHIGECPPAAPRTPTAQPELGYYVTADGTAVKVVDNKSKTRRYGLVFTPRAGRRPTWAYKPGAGYAVADLTPMGAADAARLGLSHGHCIFCCIPLGGKTLSAAVSALIGYGETCAANESLPYPKGVAAQRAFLDENGK